VHVRLRGDSGECNHVGCPNSAGELAELRADIAAGQSDKEIWTRLWPSMAQLFGRADDAGIDLVAWIAPFAVFARRC